MAEETKTPQTTDEVVEKQAGATEPQTAETIAKTESGAVSKPQEETKPEALKVEEKPKEQKRTFTEEEWAKRESELNKQSAELQRLLAQRQMELEIERQTKAEIEQQAKDLKEVDEGKISQEEAGLRQQARESQKKLAQAFNQQSTMLRQMATQAEQLGRVLAAQDFGKEYELTTEQVTELLSDKDLKTPAEMKAKAANLALEKARTELKKTKEPQERFDKGQTGGTGGGEPSDEKQLESRYPTMFKKK